MSNLSLVQVVDSKDDLLPDEFSLDLRHLSIWLALQVTMKRAAINVFHNKENLLVGFKSLVEFGQALVIQLLHDFNFTFDTLASIGLEQFVLFIDLDGYLLVQ